MFPGQQGQPNTTEGAPNEFFPQPQQPVMQPPVSGSDYPFPTEYRAPNGAYMYPVELLPMTGDRYQWVEDAPMPPDYVDHPPHSSDSSPAFQNTSIPNSDMSGRIPLVQVRKDEDNRKGETSQASNEPFPSDTTTVARSNLSPSDKPREPKPVVESKERPIIEVYPATSTELPKYVPVVEQEPAPWATVFYFEKSLRVPRTFTADKHSTSFTVGCTPGREDEESFCLAHPTSKEAKTMIIRSSIAEGIRVEKRNGSVWLTVISKNSVYVHCSFRNQVENVSPRAVVKLKFEPNENKKYGTPPSMKLFDQAWLDQQMPALINSHSKFEDLSELLQSFCTTTVSFMKGFGNDYSQRFVSSCLCWIEIHLAEPQLVYHRFLETNTGPENIGSRS